MTFVITFARKLGVLEKYCDSIQLKYFPNLKLTLEILCSNCGKFLQAVKKNQFFCAVVVSNMNFSERFL